MDWNDAYDFNYQTQVTFEEPRTLLPGDQFIQHCEYDTTSRSTMTLAGLGSLQEMCLTFVWVYPIPDLAICESSLDYDSMASWLDDAYDAGFWEGDSFSVQGLVDAGTISRPADLHPMDWEDYGISWDSTKEGANEMYDMLYNNASYEGRFKSCTYGDDVDGVGNDEASTFDEEFGDFAEYCMDDCVCGTTEPSIMPTASPVMEPTDPTNNPTTIPTSGPTIEVDDQSGSLTYNLVSSLLLLFVYNIAVTTF